jgi:hypothetical protein
LANLRFAFSPHPFFEESRYACVLEDDNYYRPNLISNAMRRLEQSTLDVFCGNSQIAQLSDSGSEIIEERYTLSPIYGDTIREIDLIARLRAYLHGFPVTNLSLVWRLNAGIDFSISDEQYNQIAQEKRRAFAWRGPMIYDPEPNSIWTNFCDRQATATTTRHSRLWRLGDMTMNTQWLDLAKQCNFKPTAQENEAIRLLRLNSFSFFAFASATTPRDVLKLGKNLIIRLYI